MQIVVHIQILQTIKNVRFINSLLPDDDTNSKEKESSTTNFVFIKTDGKNNLEKAYIDDILYVEGLKIM